MPRPLAAALALLVASAIEAAPPTGSVGGPLPAGAVLRFGTACLRPPGGADSVAFSPDGRTLATASRDAIHFWDTATGMRLGKPLRDVEYPLALAFSPDGKRLACVAVEGRGSATVHLWRLPGRTHELELPCRLHAGDLVGFSADGGVVYCAGRRGIESWALPGGKYLGGFESGVSAEDEKSCSVALTAALAGPTLTVGLPGGRLRTVDAAAKGKTSDRRAHVTEGVAALAASGDGKRVFTAAGRRIRVWPTSGGPATREWGTHEEVHELAASPDGKVVASACEDGRVSLWAAESGKLLHTVKWEEDSRGGLLFSPDGKRLALAGKRVTIVRVSSGEEATLLPGHTASVCGLAASPDGRRVASRSLDGTIRVWDAGTGRELRRVRPKGVPLGRVAFTPSGKLVWNVTESPHAIATGAISTEGKLRADATDEGEIVIRPLSGGRPVRTLKAGRVWISALAFSPDGAILASAGRPRGGVDGTVAHLEGGATLPEDCVGVTLWDTRTGRRLAGCDAEWLSWLAFSPDGRRLAGGSDIFSDVRLWGVPSLRPLWHCPGQEPEGCKPPDREVNGWAFSGDGRLMAGNGANDTLVVHDALTGEECMRFDGHDGRVNALVFLPCGTRLVTAGKDSTCLVWDLSGGHAGRIARRADAWRWRSWWADLAGARRAVSALAGASQTVDELAKRLRPAPRVDASRLPLLIAQLDHEEFEVRTQARTHLERLGGAAAPALREAQERPGASLESRMRAAVLLRHAEGIPGPELLRELRAVEVLERIGTPAARAVLMRLAAGAPGAALTREASAALARLAVTSAAAPSRR